MSWSEPENVDDIIAWLIKDLKRPYQATDSTQPFETFHREFFRELSVTPARDTSDYIAEFANGTIGNDDRKAGLKLRIILGVKVSLHHCFMASNSLPELGSKTLYNIAQASMFVGVTKGFLDSLHGGADDFLLQMAKAGARGRDNNYKPLRDFARSEVAKRNFPSRRNAALTLKPSVLALAKELEVALSEQQAERTITGWLADIPFARKRLALGSKG